ncbi:hypothetical protein RRG08_022945 [Elysia crispata]|uniref:C-type lectin domain-containing protein n=1 Tax=Elysia crispata TaxID=231223 RepID=A0AAE1DJR3_9GAST|nr:hypothetical protein RRG08_022945 [Elysia crispata]
MTHKIQCTSTLSNKASCPPGWHTSKTSQSCIKLFLSRKSWDDARKACQAQGADLLINYNKEKEKLIYEERYTLLGEACWIGLNDRNHEGSFTWLDDRQKIINLPWYRGEPTGNREDCVIVKNTRILYIFLFDERCSKTNFFICEFSLENACDKFSGSCISGISGCGEVYQGQRCDAQLCPPGWRPSLTSRSCVKVFLELKPWDSARRYCQYQRADLLINYNQENKKLIYEEKDTLLDIDCWIGLNDRKQEGDFNWLDNRQKITNVPWADGEPDNHRDQEDCGALRNQRNSGVVLFDHRCFLEKNFICELTPVCPKNTYGVKCSKRCSENCGGPENACDNFTGFCTSGCDKGYQGERCEAECTNNKFGANCLENCNQNCRGPNNACDIRNGMCTDGCDDGYQGEKCETQCEHKTFGVNCSETCSENCGGPSNTCNNVYGYCVSGCVDGYQGERCEDPCEDNKFGADCSETCSKTCAGPNNTCDQVNGSCVFGCDDGYQGERCEIFLHSKLEKEFFYSWIAIISSSIFVLVVLTCSMMCVAIQNSYQKTSSKSSLDHEGTMIRGSYPHGSSLVNETAGSLSHEEHSNFHVRFESHEKDSNVPARSVLIRNHSNLSAASRSVEEFYETETVPFDDSFPVV